MFKFFAIIGILFLSSCAAKFDGGEYSKIVDATALINPNICNDTKSIQTNIDSFLSKMDWLILYESGLPGNTDTVKLLKGIQDDANRFSEQLQVIENATAVAPSKPPTTYCKLKVDGMRHTLSIILRAEGTKAS